MKYFVSVIALLIISACTASAQQSASPWINEADRAQLENLRTDGLQALYNIDYDKAYRDFKQIATLYPNHPAGPQLLASRLWLKTLYESRRLQSSLYSSESFYTNGDDKVDAKIVDEFRGLTREAKRLAEAKLKLDPRNIDGIGNLAQIYFNVRKYEASVAMFDRIAELEPQNPVARTFRASIKLEAQAEMAPLRAVLDTIEAEGAASAAEVAPLAFDLARDERDPVAAARALANIPREGYTDPSSLPFPHAWFEGLVAKLRHDAAAAQSAFTAARSETEKIVAAQPGNAKPLSVLALIDAQLGQKDKAIQEGRAACDLLPVAKDAVDGTLLNTHLANVYALVGEKDLALQELETLSRIPCGPAYGELRLDPEWDALRGDSRFERIVASLAPKTGLKQ